MPPIKCGFGGEVTRKEDDALLRGAGRYVADHAPDGALRAVVLRSPHAHARFRITDVAKAAAMPGVALVLTASDTADLGNLPCQERYRIPRAPFHPIPSLRARRWALSVMRWPVWWRRRWPRRGTRPKRSLSSGMCCPTWSGPRRHWRRARRWCGRR